MRGLPLLHGSHMPSTPPDANIQCSNDNNPFISHQMFRMEAMWINPIWLNHAQTQQLVQKKLHCLLLLNNLIFSLVRGGGCLDNLPIKSLQETFRATCGRETTVKDKI
ncbi:hypothetical protein N665_0726s0007 [Sinapis alba]|nr:hypothetical protein N665_0726s0007 [Sinapis alba]